MTNLKREFFFLRRQLRTRFSLLILGLVVYAIFGVFCNTNVYRSIQEVPEKHVGNFKFMQYAGPESVKRDDNVMSMNGFVYKYEIDDGQYKITFTLPRSIVSVFVSVMFVLVIISVYQRINWYRRYLWAEANKKIDRRRAAMNSLKKD